MAENQKVIVDEFEKVRNKKIGKGLNLYLSDVNWASLCLY